jgi:hypothetical protein
VWARVLVLIQVTAPYLKLCHLKDKDISSLFKEEGENDTKVLKDKRTGKWGYNIEGIINDTPSNFKGL